METALNVKSRWIRRIVAASLVVLSIAALYFPAVTRARSVSLPHTFVNGEVADADQVNANFAELRDGVNDHDQRIQELEEEFALEPFLLLVLETTDKQLGDRQEFWLVDPRTGAASLLHRAPILLTGQFQVVTASYPAGRSWFSFTINQSNELVVQRIDTETFEVELSPPVTGIPPSFFVSLEVIIVGPSGGGGAAMPTGRLGPIIGNAAG